MKTDIKVGVTDRTVVVFIADPASTDGSGKTGLVAANLTVSYTRVETDNDVVVTDVTSSLTNLSTLTDAHSDWGLKEVSSTLAPGLYRLDLADAVFASGAWTAVVYVMITTSAAAASPMEFVLGANDPRDSVAQTGDGYAVVTSGTHGNAALKTLIDTVDDLVDTEVAAIKTKTDFLPSVTAGAAGGLFIAGSNAATTVNVTGNITGNLSGSVGSVTGLTAATVHSDLDDLQARLPAALVSGRMDASVGAMAADVLTAAAAAADLTTELQSGLATAASITALNNLSAAQINSEVDTAITDAALATAANLATAIGYVDTEVAAIKAKTDLIPAAPAAVANIPTAVENADAYLKRDLSLVTGEAARSPLNALRFNRNKFTIAAGVLTVYKEDDTTVAWTAVITQTAGNPVSASDPV